MSEYNSTQPTVTNQIGIKEFKEVLLFTAKLANPLLDGLQPDKDIPAIGGAFLALPAALEGIENVPAEVEDLVGVEMDEIDTILKAELTNVSGEQYERLRPKIVRFALATASLGIEAIQIQQQS